MSIHIINWGLIKILNMAIGNSFYICYFNFEKILLMVLFQLKYFVHGTLLAEAGGNTGNSGNTDNLEKFT